MNDSGLIERPELQGTLEDSSALIGDIAALRARFDETGYLLLRDVLDRELMTTMRSRWIEELQRQGILDENEEWTGKADAEIDEFSIHDALRYDELWQHPSMKAVYAMVLDEPAWVFKQVAVRPVTPSFGPYIIPPHQDGTYIGPTQDFVNVWVPFTDVDPETNGGVAIAAGSHKQGARKHVPTDQLPFNFGGGKVKMAGVPMEDISEPWESASFHPGDVLLFKPFTVHAGLPNLTSNKLRLSLDTRFQPESAPRGHYALHTTREHKQMINERGGWTEETQVPSS